jgi:hypothetical protein
VQARALVEKLREKGIQFEDGLTTVEAEEVQKRHSLSFPPDLIELLSVGLPVSKNFPNWRMGIVETSGGLRPIDEILGWPAEGISFDVRRSEFWMNSWGERPSSVDEAVSEALRQVALAPKLVPLWGHRFLPSDPLEAGNPILSVIQTDIIYYSLNLGAYFMREFGLAIDNQRDAAAKPRRIRFWSDVIDFQEEQFLHNPEF